jgi:hypothetical protein
MINICVDGNYIFHKTFGVFAGYGNVDPGKVFSKKSDQTMFIRKVATDQVEDLFLQPIAKAGEEKLRLKMADISQIEQRMRMSIGLFSSILWILLVANWRKWDSFILKYPERRVTTFSICGRSTLIITEKIV